MLTYGVALALASLSVSTSAHYIAEREYPNRSASGVSFFVDGITSSLQCSYPELDPNVWEPCNNATDRACWLRNKQDPSQSKTITSNYEDPNIVPVGQIREYWLDVSYTELAPDGFQKRVTTFNGTYPGPKLEACWGDTLVVHVRNLLPDNGTTVHWHGVRQLNTSEMDGVPSTQCPIARQTTFTYKFKAYQYGTTWYHSHLSLQYPNGLTAPLLIYGPTSADWDKTTDPVLISDWVHPDAFVEYQNEKQLIPSMADSIVVNGKGVDPHGNQTITVDNYSNVTLSTGKKNRIRLINGSAGTSYHFSIDNHIMTVIATDFVSIEPYNTTSLFIAIGQRYTVIVQALDDPTQGNTTNGNYWVRTRPADGCNIFRNGQAFAAGTEPFANFTAIATYSTVPYAIPSKEFVIPGEPTACQDEATTNLRPIVQWTIDRESLNNVTETTFLPTIQKNASTDLGPEGRYRHWMLRMDPDVEQSIRDRTSDPTFSFSDPLWLNFSRPTLLNLDDPNHIPNTHYNVVNFTFPAQPTNGNPLDPGFVYMVIDATDLKVNDSKSGPPPPVAHPIHWHGSDVVVLAQRLNETFNPRTSPATWQYDNPPRRDVVLIPAGGYIAIAFKPDNPGAWLVHCHIAWHQSSGLALQMIVQQDKIPGALGQDGLNTIREGCNEWDADVAKGGLGDKDDSGI